MQHLEVSGAVRPLKWALGVKYLIAKNKNKYYVEHINFIVDRSRLHVSTLIGSSSGLILEQVFKILRTLLGSH